MSDSHRALKRIAILNPLNDYGISGYTHEFAEGLASNGHVVSVYADLNASLQDIPLKKSYTLLPVLGKALLKQPASTCVSPFIAVPPGAQISHDLGSQRSSGTFARVLNSGNSFSSSATALPWVQLDPARSSMREALYSTSKCLTTPIGRVHKELHGWVRKRFLASELAYHLWREKYDLVWTQWYSPDVFDSEFWLICKKLRIPVVHTVHNVLPHEPVPKDRTLYRNVYTRSKLLVVHSRHAMAELTLEFPNQADKALIMPHGTYSTLHRRTPEARAQVRRALRIKPDSPVLLFCGLIRPYKNIDAVIEAIKAPAFSQVTLVIAGKESKYPDVRSSDPLYRTRTLLRKWEVESQARLLPQMLGTGEMSELLEASDILLLPYLKGYGSGLLLLGMTFGKYVVTTTAGGADEYLRNYKRSTLLNGPFPADLVLGLNQALKEVRRSPIAAIPPPELSWGSITAKAVREIERRLA